MLRKVSFLLVLLAVTGPLSRPGAVRAEDPQDAIIREIGVDERIGASVPLDLSFADPDGKAVRLGDYFTGGPVVLTLNYYRCPMLCPLTFRNLAGTVGSVRDISLGRDYRIVTVSFDPGEIPGMARLKSGETYEMLEGVKEPGKRWPFLSGREDEIRRLTEAVGYRYRKVGTEFAHPAAFVVLTPGGKISRYLYGIELDPRDFRLALLEASQGRIGESRLLNQALLYCFHYDPVGKKYALYATNLMKAGGAATLVLLGGLLVILWRRERASKPPAPEGRG